MQLRRRLAFVASLALAPGCGSYGGHGGSPNNSITPGAGSGNVATSGGADFAAFRDALQRGVVPPPDSLDAAGFFAEHFTALPPPTCGDPICAHGMLSVSPDEKGQPWTLVQLAMNSPIDPATVQRAPLDLAVVLDHSGSMAENGKMGFALAGVDQLVDELGDADTLTLIAFDSTVETVFGPAPVVDRAALHAAVDAIAPAGGTNLHDALQAGYRALGHGDETRLARVILLTDGLPTVGITDDKTIEAMSDGFNEAHLGLTTIGLGSDVNTLLLRTLAERGGGNFYFIEQPAAVTEVFHEELAFFVAPLAYDVDLTLELTPGDSITELFGSSAWLSTQSGGSVHVPALYLASRQTADPGASGGRRGGGSALIAHLAQTPDASAMRSLASVTLSYRNPGATTRLEQKLSVDYDPALAGAAGYYSTPTMEKNTIVLDFFVAFRAATARAQNDRAGARSDLVAFRDLITPRLAARSDADLADDLALVARYIEIL